MSKFKVGDTVRIVDDITCPDLIAPESPGITAKIVCRRVVERLDKDEFVLHSKELEATLMSINSCESLSRLQAVSITHHKDGEPYVETGGFAYKHNVKVEGVGLCRMFVEEELQPLNGIEEIYEKAQQRIQASR